MTTAPSPPARLVSLDAFRGATIAAMILVNNPGDWGHIHWPLDHAPWHGWTPTDLIFPFFLFIVGVSLTFSTRLGFRPALRRALTLVALGLFMAAFPFFDLTTLRWPGVLQRIGLCYLAAWAARRFLGPRGQAGLAAGILLLYWALMTQVPGPAGGAPSLERETNVAARVDRVFLSGHMWKQTRTWDPEGLLSTLPAIATTILGLLAGEWLRSARSPATKVVGLLGGGIALVLAGLAWGVGFPINKNLWTSSYVLFTGGMAAYALGACHLVIDVWGRRAWARPFVTYGVNAIFVFVASGLLAKLLVVLKWPGPDGRPLALQAHLFRALFLPLASPVNASLLYAVANVVFWYLVLHEMDRRGIRIKV
jgi:predicted acyltransferase